MFSSEQLSYTQKHGDNLLMRVPFLASKPSTIHVSDVFLTVHSLSTEIEEYQTEIRTLKKKQTSSVKVNTRIQFMKSYLEWMEWIL